MLRYLTALTVGTLVFAQGCDKKDDASAAPAATSQAAGSGSVERKGPEHERELERDRDGGRSPRERPPQ